MSEIVYERESRGYYDEKGRMLDCVECNGSSRLVYPDGSVLDDARDCYTCGGTGWQPPARDPDAQCTGCKRPLWIGVRGPKWFSLGSGPIDEMSEPTCSHCLRRRKFERRHPEFAAPDSNEITLDDFNPRRDNT